MFAFRCQVGNLSAHDSRVSHSGRPNMASHLRGSSRKLLAAVAQLGSAQCRAGAGFLDAHVASPNRRLGRPRQVRQFTAGGSSWAAAASGTGPLVEQMQDKIREGLGGADEGGD